MVTEVTEESIWHQVNIKLLARHLVPCFCVALACMLSFLLQYSFVYRMSSQQCALSF